MKTPNTLNTRSFTARAFLVALFSQLLASNVSAECVVPPSGLVSWWRGETNALDYVGTNHGTVAGNTIYGAGRVGQGFTFDGNGAVVQLGNPASLHLQDLTIETWIRRASAATVSLNGNGNGVIFGYGTGGYGLYLDANGTPTLSKIGYNEVKPGIAITDTNLHHVAVSKVGNTVVFYVDGISYSAAAYDPGFTFSENVFIGGLGSFYTFYGTVDELSVYSRALATNEVQAIYTAGSAGKCVAVPPPSCTPAPLGLVGWWGGNGSANDLAGANNGSFVNPSYGTGKVNQAFNFDGSGNHVRIPASSLLDVGAGNGLTIEAWVNPADLGQHPIVEWALNGDYGVHLWANAQNPGYLYGSLFGTDGQPHVIESTTSVLNTNVFQHVGMTYDKASGIARLFVNGVIIRELAVGTFTPRTSSDFYVGYRPAGSPYGPIPFLGKIDEVSIYNRALSPTELQAIYTAASAGKCAAGILTCATPPSGLVSWWRGETNALDQVGTNNGTIGGNTAYGSGRVNQAFVFDGSGDGVSVGNPPELQLQTFTIETWIKRSDSTRGSQDPFDSGVFFCYAWGGYAFALHDNGKLFLGKVGYSSVDSTLAITDTNTFHHVAVTKTGNNVIFYLDGVGQTAAPYDPGFVFGGPAAIGARGGDLVASFLGAIDELSVYNRPLTAGEIQTIYTAGSNGKCLSGGGFAPLITSQPATQTVTVGGAVAFSVTASGTAPLSYQWRLNSTNIAGATADSLVITNVQLAVAGVYSVVVSNPVGTATSSNATLTVNTLQGCAALPSGLVSWWRGEANGGDQTGTNNGTLVGNTTYGAGQVGQAFVFDGNGDAVRVTSPVGLQLQTFTIETWIKRSSSSVSSLAHPTYAGLFCWGGGGYALGLRSDGQVYLSEVEVGAVGIENAVTDTNWHHVAVTKSGSVVAFYIDGVGQVAPPYNPNFTFGTPVAIGAQGDNLAASFYGAMDEVAVYNRQLSAGEIQAIYSAGSSGKCTTPPPACTPTPPGLVSWWRGETNALDQAGTNIGTLTGNTIFGAGRVGQGFVFDGSGDGVSVGNPPELQLQTFTIEAWIKRSSSSIVSQDPYQSGILFSYPWGGYAFALWDDGRLFMGKNGESAVFSTLTVTDTNLHHVAVTKIGSTVVFYMDGVAETVAGYDPGFVFGGPAAIGARGGDLAASFVGSIDELAIYNRPLTAGEVQAIFNAGSNGKCLSSGGVAPLITSHPSSQTVTIGELAIFSVAALGTAPLSYQWRWNSTNIAGATADSLVLTNVQPAAAGVYSVIVSNPLGTVTSSNATLTVNTLLGCASPPSGLVSWWRGEANAADQAGGNNGTLVGNTAFGAGRVSQAFVFDGSGDGVSVGNPSSLQLQTFTIEAWIKRSDASRGSQDSQDSGLFFCYAWGGYAFALHDNGKLFLSKVGYNSVDSSLAITDTNNFHHVAVTKAGTNVVFYLDGTGQTAAPYDPGFVFDGPAAIGARGGDLVASFLGAIDEVSVYNRSLSSTEIQAIYNAGSSGKCLTAIPASIVTQPANKTVAIGANTTFSVTAGGTPPFSYQWRFNGTSITNATNATLTLANVQASQAGSYSVVVGNAASSPPVLSSNATLTVTYPVANVRLFGTNIVSGRPVTLPIRIAANGNENAVSFSLTYTTTRLNFRTAQLGDFPPGTLLFVNTSQTNLGRLGVTVALPSGATFAPGTQLLAGVTFDATISLAVSPIITQISFGDSPMVRGLTDVNALTLPATFTGSSVMLSGTDLEGDGSPRPGGSRSFTVNDWVQAGRFAAKLDLPAAGGEFQRADAAPRGTAGDGQIKVNDWVQAGRYFAGLDPLTAVGGPTLEVGPTGPLGPDAVREVRVLATNAIQDLAVTVPVTLQAVGNENGVGFTVSYDPATFSYVTASLGSGAAGANFNLNTNQVAAGKLGLVLVLPTGSSFAAGAREIARISLRPTVVGSSPVSLGDQLVLRGVSDSIANELPAAYVAGTVTVNPHPTLQITHAGTNVALAWPALASGFNLQSATNATVSGGWSDVLDTPQAEGDNLKVTLPLTDQTKYFRLRHP